MPGHCLAHVVFDLDGTLIDSSTDLVDAVNHVLASLGRPTLPPRTLVQFVGNGARVLLQKALAAVGDDRLDLGVERFMEYYATHLLDRTQPYAGIVALLDEIQRTGAYMTILSNKPEGMSRAIVAGLGWSAYFGAVLGGDSLPTRKPDPAGLLQLIASSGVPPIRTVLVGDSVVDQQTAGAAGITFCGVTWGFGTEALRAAHPDHLIDVPGALLPIVAASATR